MVAGLPQLSDLRRNMVNVTLMSAAVRRETFADGTALDHDVAAQDWTRQDDCPI
jgi:hypothetical protein